MLTLLASGALVFLFTWPHLIPDNEKSPHSISREKARAWKKKQRRLEELAKEKRKTKIWLNSRPRSHEEVFRHLASVDWPVRVMLLEYLAEETGPEEIELWVQHAGDARRQEGWSPDFQQSGEKENYFLVYLRGRFSKEDYLMLEEYRSTQPEVAEWFMDKRQGETFQAGEVSISGSEGELDIV
jgi:hypothetical protein